MANKIKVNLTRTYEYDVSEILAKLKEAGYNNDEIDDDLLKEIAKTEALEDFISEVVNEVDYFADSIEDFVGATATIVGTGSEHNTSYNLIMWPESQNFMEEEWFENEAILALGNEDITGSSAYFIPTHRLKNDNSNRF